MTSLVSKAYPDLYEINELAEEIARESAGRLVVDISTTQRKVIRRLVGQAIAEGWGNEYLSARIAERVGLDMRYSQAVDRFREYLYESNVPRSEVARRVREYAARLRVTRARRIAQNEVQTAMNAAQRALWTQQQQDGDLSPYAVRVTHTVQGCCSQCRKENGRRRSLKTPEGGPPFHPACRCYETIEDQGILKTAPELVGIKKAKEPVDGDGDGFVLDGKPGMRPATPKVRKPRVRAFTDRQRASRLKPLKAHPGDEDLRVQADRVLDRRRTEAKAANPSETHSVAMKIDVNKRLTERMIAARNNNAELEHYFDGMAIEATRDAFDAITQHESNLDYRIKRLNQNLKDWENLNTVQGIIDRKQAQVDRYKDSNPSTGMIAELEGEIRQWKKKFDDAERMAAEKREREAQEKRIAEVEAEKVAFAALIDSYPGSEWHTKKMQMALKLRGAHAKSQIGQLGRPLFEDIDADFAENDAYRDLLVAKKVREVIDQWAASSMDSDAPAIALQYAVHQTFGAGTLDTIDRYDREDGIDYYEKHKAFLDHMVREMYMDTQELLEDMNISEVQLWRGMHLEDTEPARKWAGHRYEDAQREVNELLAPLSSWSVSETVARGFSKENNGSYVPVLLSAVVPREAIFSSTVTGIGCLDEAEFVLIGHEGSTFHAEALRPDSRPSPDFDWFENPEALNKEYSYWALSNDLTGPQIMRLFGQGVTIHDYAQYIDSKIARLRALKYFDDNPDEVSIDFDKPHPFTRADIMFLAPNIEMRNITAEKFAALPDWNQDDLVDLADWWEPEVEDHWGSDLDWIMDKFEDKQIALAPEDDYVIAQNVAMHRNSRPLKGALKRWLDSLEDDDLRTIVDWLAINSASGYMYKQLVENDAPDLLDTHRLADTISFDAQGGDVPPLLYVHLVSTNVDVYNGLNAVKTYHDSYGLGVLPPSTEEILGLL